MKTCLKYKINKNLDNFYIKRNNKTGSAIKDLGCSIDEFKKHLESKFLPGMTWENYGRSGWHIDHIRPLSSFDLSSLEDLKKACHYTNMQPMWWYNNLSKSNRVSNGHTN